jgi:cell wall-associated NlpC family hydrolase
VAQLTAAPLESTATAATVIAPSAWLLDHGVPAMEVSFGTRLPVIWSRDSIVHVAVPGGVELDVPANAVSVTDAGAPALPSTAAAVMASMKLFLNVRYLWAGTSGFGYDCSGLMYTVFKVHGIALPRDAQDQAVIGAAVGRQNLRPGDLVFLASGGVVHHVAIYAGGGMLLDSPDLGRGVQMVSMSVAPYSTEYAGARRLLPA